MLKYAEVGVEPCHLVLEQPGASQIKAEAADAGTCRFHILQMLLERADGPVCCVDPSRLDNAPDDAHSLPDFLGVYLIRMQFHVEFLLQGYADQSDRSHDILFSIAYDGHIVDKTHVSAMEASHYSQSDAVEEREEEGAEQLRSDVADRHTSVRRRVEAALLRIEELPQVNRSTPLAV